MSTKDIFLDQAGRLRCDPAWKPAWRHAAEANGTPPASYIIEPIEAYAVFTLKTARVATLPDGSRVELPAGTVLREGTLPPEIEPTEPRTLGEQLHDEHNRTAHADGSPCLCDPASAILADLTERVGLPREMAPSEWPTPRTMAEIACRKRTLGQGFQSGFEEGVTAERARSAVRVGPNPILCDLAERVTFERMSSQAFAAEGLEDGAILGTVGPEGAIVPADPDPWLAGLTITTANAIRSGIDRGLPAKAGVAAVIAAFQAGVDMAIDPPRCTGKRPANAGTTGIECDDYACNAHGRGAIRRLHEMAPSAAPARTFAAEEEERQRSAIRTSMLFRHAKPRT